MTGPTRGLPGEIREFPVEVADSSVRMQRRDLIDAVLDRAAVTVTDAHADLFRSSQVLVELVVPLVTDRLMTQDVPVHLRGEVVTDELPRSVLVELPQPWWRRLLRLRVRRVWCPVVANAAVHDPGDRIEVTGRGVVPVDYLLTFPQFDAGRYPNRFGPAVQVMRERARDGEATNWWVGS